MKRSSFYSLILLFLFSCSDDDFEIDYWGTITADYNGEAWSAYIEGTNNAYSPDLFNMLCDVYDQKYLREHLLFGSLPRAVGTYSVHPRNYDDLENRFALYSTRTSHGDVMCDNYKLDEQAAVPNQVEITRIEGTGRLIEGTFTLTFYIDRPEHKCNPNAPDTIKFRNGSFKTKIMR